MKSFFLIFLSLFCWINCSAQISERDKKQISKIVGQDFVVLPNQKSYPYCAFSDSFKLDMSTTLLNDTVGVSFHNEHLLWHDLISFCGKEEVLKLAKPSYVTVDEYLEFQNWVRDSIAREMIYFNLGEGRYGRRSGYKNEEWIDDDHEKWINFKNIYWDKNLGEYVEADPSDRELCRKLFSLNWDRKLTYTDPQIIPCIVNLYLPQPERINRVKEFDDRLFSYKYQVNIKDPYSCRQDSLFSLFPFQKLNRRFMNYFLNLDEIVLDEITATRVDQYLWAQRSTTERDEFSVLAHTYTKLFQNSPIIGINNKQAKAYFHWKQEVLQKELNKKQLPYTVIVSLPTELDNNGLNQKHELFTIASKDYTEQWRITNSQYNLFIESVRDSILKENLFLNSKMDETLKIINSTDLYFDENTWEYTEYDLSDRVLARFIFPLNNSFKLKNLSSASVKIIDSIKLTSEYIDANFRYLYCDSKDRSYIGKFETKNDPDSLYLIKDSFNLYEYVIGKDLNLSYTDILGENTGVRSHENLQVYTKYIELAANAEVDKQHPDSLIQTITYEQAIAYYYWKYPIHNPNPKDDWQKFVLPTKEQFEAVQSGKQIIIPEKKVAYPTPLFRYVVHVYPK